jgi:hypothetical protein
MINQAKSQEPEIITFFHCKECLSELPKEESPKSFQRIQVGFTQKGIQVWCVRHNINIVHLDFDGQKVKIA